MDDAPALDTLASSAFLQEGLAGDFIERVDDFELAVRLSLANVNVLGQMVVLCVETVPPGPSEDPRFECGHNLWNIRVPAFSTAFFQR